MIKKGTVKSLEAKKLKDENYKDIKINVSILDIKFEKDGMNISFEQTVNYEPGIAVIKVGGVVINDYEGASRKEYEDDWKKNKKLPTKIVSDVISAINYMSSTAGTLGAYAIGVRAPINTPRAKVLPKSPEKKKK